MIIDEVTRIVLLEEKGLTYTFPQSPIYIRYSGEYGPTSTIYTTYSIYRSKEDPFVYLQGIPTQGSLVEENYIPGTWVLFKYFPQELDIPRYLEEALQAYTAYSYFSNRAGQDQQQLAAIHYSRFRESCLRLDEANLLRIGYESTIALLEDRGWR